MDTLIATLWKDANRAAWGAPSSLGGGSGFSCLLRLLAAVALVALAFAALDHAAAMRLADSQLASTLQETRK